MMELEARPFSTTKLVEATEQSAWLGWGDPFSQILLYRPLPLAWTHKILYTSHKIGEMSTKNRDAKMQKNTHHSD
jgi:hypothetical protein